MSKYGGAGSGGVYRKTRYRRPRSKVVPRSSLLVSLRHNDTSCKPLAKKKTAFRMTSLFLEVRSRVTHIRFLDRCAAAGWLNGFVVSRVTTHDD